MAQDNYNYSGSFEVEECKVITHHGNSVPLDLDGVLSVVSVYEDIMPVSYTHLTLPTICSV